MFGRTLSAGFPIVAAIRGHAAAAGCMLACAADYRVMSSDAGSIRMTEAAIGMVLPRGGNLMVSVKNSPSVHRDLLLRAKSFEP